LSQNNLSIDQTAQGAKNQGTKFVREAEEERTRRAYLEQPDSEADTDDWSSAEEWKP
jgi:hypothetical protein